MSRYENGPLKVAILDMYEGAENQGMRCLREILNQFAELHGRELVRDEFNVRQHNELPDLSYDIYLCSGGPGSPLDSVGSIWENSFFDWIKSVENYNSAENNIIKKPVFFICHSFQLACRYFNVAEVSKRKSTAFGVFPIHFLADASSDVIFKGLTAPFYAVDSRDYQVTKPNHKAIKKIGGKILAIEKNRPHVPLERAIMSIRFNDYMVGTQFHPEADALSFIANLKKKETREKIIAMKGKTKFRDMLEDLLDEEKIYKTNETLIPNFLRIAINDLMNTRKILSN